VSNSIPQRPKLAILTNVLAPYRLPVFKRLAEQFEVTVLYSGEESNREHWNRLAHQVHGFHVKRASGFTFGWTKRDRGAVLDSKYLHLNPGFFTDLVRLQPDAIITNEMGFRSIAALTYGRMFRRPVWVWWGGTCHTERGIGTMKQVFRSRFVSRVPRWFSYGVTSTEYLVSLGVDRKRVVELQNCVPESHYTVPVAPGFQLKPAPVVLCAGRLVPGKGVDLFLRAAARVQQQGRTFSTLVVGDGLERRPLEQLASDLALANVQFHAGLPPQDMPAVYRSADVLVFPTLDDVWGLVVNEALWSGLPALVSVYAGCARELVPPESTFDPLDPVDFAAKLGRAVDGELPAPELIRLRRIADVSDLIAEELHTTLSRTKGATNDQQTG
jgi:glycosyltransferase involved in cell wall biosynthesis